jgi:hypothetical protein
MPNGAPLGLLYGKGGIIIAFEGKHRCIPGKPQKALEVLGSQLATPFFSVP